MSVSFTDEDEVAMLEKGYETDQSELGNVYYPREGIKIPDHIIVLRGRRDRDHQRGNATGY